ncbi:MAG: ATP-dependent sacrificial sulfur transferase LarE [Oscillospiraceae bacterium]|jgi:uncharacterized protein|nr:ATP-dependent sacrificial sulfur transferase LarE [Oscillospiraceae bacterium]
MNARDNAAELEKRYSDLKQNIKNLGNVAVAFSGGVDSTFLIKVCRDVLGDRAIAVTIRSDLQPAREYAGSDEFVEREGIRHYIIDFNGYELECFKKNPPDRCYFCKKEILAKVFALAESRGIANVADGSNLDDTGDYRPGGRAVKEMNVKSPLLEAGLSKWDIRALSKNLGLHTWNKHSPACMASRFPYGTAITPERIAMVSRAEQYLLDLGFSQFRVRVHGEAARIEVLNEEMDRFFDREFMSRTASAIKKLGFAYVSLDLEGYRTGSMNENI